MTITLVQVATNHSSTLVNNLLVTLSSPATAGNCLVACIGGHSANAVTSVISSASPDQWGTTAAVTASAGAETCEIWTDPGCAGGNTTVSCHTTNTGLVIMQVYEFSGIAASSPVDVTASAVSIPQTSSWSSGATGSTLAGDLVIGASCGFAGGGAYSLFGPGGSWTNEPYIATSMSSIGIWVRLITGYEVPGSGTATYSGTSSVSQEWGAAAVALKAAGGGGGGGGSAGSFLPFFA